MFTLHSDVDILLTYVKDNKFKFSDIIILKKNLFFDMKKPKEFVVA